MKRRGDAREAIEKSAYDVCVIGGGATGAGCALDAQLRGLRTVMVEAGDFVSHTSAASTKLAHGGVRYLRQAVAELDIAQYGLVKKALQERRHMLRCAPHLAHALELLVPCFSAWELAYYALGMKVYDWIAGKASLFPSRMLSKAESLRRMPTLRSEGLVGCVAFADGQFDDARFGLTLTQTFAREGGEAINYAEVVEFGRDARGRLETAQMVDRVSGERFEVRAKVFVNCTGPFGDGVRKMANPALGDRLRLSKGVHVLLPLEVLRSRSALLIPKTEDGRVIFAIPWKRRLLVGTTDDEAEIADEKKVTEEEVRFLLKYVNDYLHVNLTAKNVVAAFAGVRPLVRSGERVKTKRLSRDHEVEVDAASGLISVLGGKWTTYRAMAEDGIDRAQEMVWGRRGVCRTRGFLLAGAKGFSSDYWKELVPEYGVSRETARRLAGKFGTNAVKVLELVREDAELGEVLGAGAIRAEVVYAVREEMAQTVEDVLMRRMGLQFYSWAMAVDCAPVVGKIMARELGWSEAKLGQALAEYVSEVRNAMRRAGTGDLAAMGSSES